MPPPSFAAPANTRLSEAVFAVGYARINEAFLQPVDLGRLAVDGLKGVSTLDNGVRVERAGDTVRVYVAERPVFEGMAPKPTDGAGWAALTARAIEKARAASPPLREVEVERIYQVVYDGVTADLDGFSRYAGATKASGERAQREGYGGIGVTLELSEGRHVIRAVTMRSPADAVGVRAGDVLAGVDGDPAAAMDELTLRERLRGPAGSPVLVTIERAGETARRLPIRRERVVPSTVSVATGDHVAIIKVERFNSGTATNLRDGVQAARRVLGNDARGLILDLRGNPGGLLDQAVAVADLFIRHGRILTTEGRHPDSRQRFDAVGTDVAEGLPIVVLVDGRTASSAEVVAAALQDSGRAVIVGSASFGKGSVQTVTRLPNDGELFLTWSRILTPAGYTLHRQGVQPIVCTSRDNLTPDGAVGELRDGRGRSFAAQLASLRAAAAHDETALSRLRGHCAWKEHPAALDVEVAKRLLGDPRLYQRAVSLATTSAVAER